MPCDVLLLRLIYRRWLIRLMMRALHWLFSIARNSRRNFVQRFPCQINLLDSRRMRARPSWKGQFDKGTSLICLQKCRVDWASQGWHMPWNSTSELPTLTGAESMQPNGEDDVCGWALSCAGHGWSDLIFFAWIEFYAALNSVNCEACLVLAFPPTSCSTKVRTEKQRAHAPQETSVMRKRCLI